jgi:hypothetical protein
MLYSFAERIFATLYGRYLFLEYSLLRMRALRAKIDTKPILNIFHYMDPVIHGLHVVGYMYYVTVQVYSIDYVQTEFVMSFL